MRVTSNPLHCHRLIICVHFAEILPGPFGFRG